ncbi:gluconokinase [Antrihabitans cavernicola]|uniref:Gluconokinase n=1 Tax=Antrihabitans cavernicola TaxID=2495913 RepID=A0A5A7S924_9NOCA|nr:gluconokinase [Spelaeibacter cavernicola]KAA0021652.1 gluconokinase [Spelaeibacter cavernicola]
MIGHEDYTPATVLVIMGVSGTGKSTIAALLAGSIGWQLVEGDDLHPPTNIAKMSAGIALTDADRDPWLDLIAQRIGSATSPLVLTCSALTRRARDRIYRPGVVFVHLQGDRVLIERRLRSRLDHFMPASLLLSQLATLEPPNPDEPHITVDVGGDPADITAAIRRTLDLSPTR